MEDRAVTLAKIPHLDEARRKRTAGSSRRRTGREVTLDYDLLVSNVEKSIMADQERPPAVLTPQELLLKSNPGIFDKDLTNPRDMYSLLSTKTRSSDDLNLKLKQEFAKTVQNSASLPKLHRAATMREIRRTSRLDKHGPHQSTSELSTPRKQVNVFLLTRNRTSIEDLRRVTVEEKENLRSLNLPNIVRNVGPHEGFSRDFPNLGLSLPTVGHGHLPHKDEDLDGGEKPVSPKKKKTRMRDEGAHDNVKIDKWFSEMPNEVLDKAERALMEETIRDKLQRYQQRRSKKGKSGHSKVRNVPNTFLELRVDSFGRHLHAEGNEKLTKYKLHQKSLHQLKLREMDEAEKGPQEDFDSPRISTVQHRSHTTLTKKSTPEEKQPKKVIPKTPDKGLKTVNMNDLALDGALRPNPRIAVSRFEEYNDRFNVYKAVPNNSIYDHSIHHSRVPEKDSYHSSLASKEISDDEIGELEKELTKASIVNLALKKDRGNMRRTLNPSQSPGHANHRLKEDDEELYDADTDSNDDADYSHRPSRIVATIPTAKSQRTNDSTSTSSTVSQQKGPKEVLKKFNRLEVFSENTHAAQVEMARTSYHGQSRRSQDATNDKPMNYKLDLKQYPLKTPQKSDGNIIPSEVRVQEVVFRFEPGEVFVTRKNNLAQGRASERARIIYGKAVTKDDRKNDQQSFKDGQSQVSNVTGTSRLDGYHAEMATFETRALICDSVASVDHRPDTHLTHGLIKSTTAEIGNIESVSGEEGAEEEDEYFRSVSKTPLPVEVLNRKGKLVRDMATVTDLRGPEGPSDTGDDYDLGKEPAPAPPPQKDPLGLDSNSFRGGVESGLMRPDSDMSDFIQENDAGEGLDSDCDSEIKSASTSIKLSASERNSPLIR